MSLVCFRIPSGISDFISLPCLLWLPLVVTISWTHQSLLNRGDIWSGLCFGKLWLQSDRRQVSSQRWVSRCLLASRLRSLICGAEVWSGGYAAHWAGSCSVPARSIVKKSTLFIQVFRFLVYNYSSYYYFIYIVSVASSYFIVVYFNISPFYLDRFCQSSMLLIYQATSFWLC